MVTDVGHPEWLGVADQQAEHPSPARQRADRAVRDRIDPGGDEVGERLARVVEDPDRRVVRARQLPRDLQQALEHPFELALGDN